MQERIAGRIRRAVNLVPGFWGAIMGMAFAASLDLPAAVVVGGATVVGLGVGRAFWNMLSARSRTRVEELAAELERRALAAEGERGPVRPN